MAHHKRHRRKNRRAGCIYCKPQKANGHKRIWSLLRRCDRRELIRAAEQIRDL